MAWSYPVLTAMKTVAVAANGAVRAAAGNTYVAITDCEANKLRFEYAVSLVMANQELVNNVKAQLFEALRKYFLGWLVGVSPLVRIVIGFAIEAAYQAMKAAAAKPPVVKAVGVNDDWDYKLVKHVHENGGAEVVLGPPRTGAPVSQPAPKTIVDIHEQAEPGDTR